MMPARYISAITSMMPEPHTPVMPVAAVASLETALVGPQIRADELETRFERLTIDAHALDRSGRRALPAADLRAFECRARGTRAGHQARAIAEHDLGVGADVHQQSHLVGKIRAFSQHHAGGIRADVPGNARQHVNARVAIELQIDRIRAQRE